ncbi:MAG: hypothetical protein AAB426_13270, partial [Myxococcota bacterium]
LKKTSPLTAMGEGLATLSGEGTGIRDAYQDKKISTTDAEIHERSEVLTGAAYNVLQGIYRGLLADPAMQRQHGARLPLWAMTQAGDIMGKFMVRAADYTPETQVTLEDVGKACLSVDREYFGGAYHDLWARELETREIFTKDSVAAWQAHVASLPQLRIDPKATSKEALSAFVQEHLTQLGVDARFGLRLQSTQVDADGRTLVRVQLTEGRGERARALQNHGLVVFRADGTLCEYQPALPTGLSSADAAVLLAQATRTQLDARGAGDVALVRDAEGKFTVQTVVAAPGRFDRALTVYSLEHPQGVAMTEAFHRPDVRDRQRVARLLPPGATLLTA